jgi:hypothetical protein
MRTMYHFKLYDNVSPYQAEGHPPDKPSAGSCTTCIHATPVCSARSLEASLLIYRNRSWVSGVIERTLIRRRCYLATAS